jgi:hypothetical protein
MQTESFEIGQEIHPNRPRREGENYSSTFEEEQTKSSQGGSRETESIHFVPLRATTARLLASFRADCATLHLLHHCSQHYL